MFTILLIIAIAMVACGSKRSGEQCFHQAIACVNKGEMVEAVVHAQEALELFEASHDSDGIFNSKVYLSMVYGSMGQDKESYDMLKSIRIRKSAVNDSTAMFYQNYLRLYALFASKDDDRKTLALFNQLLELEKGKPDEKKSELYLDMANKAEILVKLGRYQEAKILLDSIDHHPITDKRNYVDQVYYARALLAFKQADYANAEHYARMCIKYQKPYTSWGNYENSLLILLKVDQYKADFASYIAHRDSLDTVRRDYKGQEMKYRLALLNEQSKLESMSKDANISRLWSWLISILAAFLLITLILIYRHSKNRLQLAANKLQVTALEKQQKEDELERKRLENELLQLKMSQKDEKLSEAYEENTQISLKLAGKNEEDTETTPLDHLVKVMKQKEPEFIQRLHDRLPRLSYNEFLIMGFTRMGISSKDIAAALSITSDGLKKARYRLRKKLNLESTEELEKFIREI